jgi:glycosyltransferase involved in cell wall biosynthesis
MRVLALTRYGRQGASSRLRLAQFMQPLANAGIRVLMCPLVTDDMLRARYESGRYASTSLVHRYALRVLDVLRATSFDVAFVQNELFPWLPAWVDQMAMTRIPVVVDYDDAAFHRYDQHRSPLVRKLLGRRIDYVMKSAARVIAGNDYIAIRARSAGAQGVTVIPTVVDLERYEPRQSAGMQDGARIAWIGQPTNAHYLQIVGSALQSAAATGRLTLRAIGARAPKIDGVDSEHFPWRETDEARLIRESDIGIMPLPDDPWERGKCGYKLIQYMACGLPVLASPVGANQSIVRHGETGFLCSTQDEWTHYLQLLASDPALRDRMGLAGRRVVEEHYSLRVAAPRLVEVLRSASVVGRRTIS